MKKLKPEVESLEGFEPSTRCLEGSRSVQLSYRDKLLTIQMVARAEGEVKMICFSLCQLD